jgi:hypothetical protein
MKPTDQTGQALTELTISLPVILVFIGGAHWLFQSLKTSLHSDLMQRVQETSFSRVPAWARGHWPRDSVRTKAKAHAKIVNRSTDLRLSLCIDSPRMQFAGAGVDTSHHFEDVYPYFSDVRDLSRALLRVACVGENVALGGGAVAAATLAGLRAMPHEAIRRRAVYSICPVVANSSQGLRDAAALTSRWKPWTHATDVVKSLQSSQVICISR